MWLVTVSTVAADEPVVVTVGARVLDGTLSVRLAPSSPIALRHILDDRDLLVTSEVPFRVDLGPDFGQVAAGFVATVQSGYDSLLLRLVRGVDVVVTSGPAGLDLRLTRPAGGTSPDDLAERRLALLRAHWHAARGDERRVLRTIAPLLDDSSGDPEAWATLALAERRIGRRRRAEAALRRAQQFDPLNPELTRIIDTWARERAPRGRVDAEVRRVAGEWSLWSDRVEGWRPVGPAAAVGARLDLGRFDAHRVRRADGTVGPIRRAVHRGEAWVDHDTVGGMSWSATVAAAPSGPGIGFIWSRPDVRGRWSGQVEVRRPFWEFVEGLAHDGTRSRLAVERMHRFPRRVDAWLAVGLHDYRLDGDARARSWALSGAMYVLVREHQPSVMLVYGFDRETRRSVSVLRDPDGQPYEPIPLASRELHLPGLQAGYRAGNGVSVDVRLAYLLNRLGGHGPIAEGRLRLERGRLTLEGFVERRYETFTTPLAVTRAGGGLTVRMGGTR